MNVKAGDKVNLITKEELIQKGGKIVSYEEGMVYLGFPILKRMVDLLGTEVYVISSDAHAISADGWMWSPDVFEELISSTSREDWPLLMSIS